MALKCEWLGDEAGQDSATPPGRNSRLSGLLLVEWNGFDTVLIVRTPPDIEVVPAVNALPDHVKARILPKGPGWALVHKVL